MNGVASLSCGGAAEAFSTYFASCFNTTRAESKRNELASCGLLPVTLEMASQFSCVDLLRAAKKIKPNLTSGFDSIPGFFLRDCISVLTEPLLHIFNLILSSCLFPDIWKTSKVVPILKKGDRSDVTNYRPIVLLSNISKLFEFCLYNSIITQINNRISEHQHGFVSGRSTVSNLVLITQFIAEHLDCNTQVDVIYTDFTKAFDRIDHALLLLKLDQFGFSDSLLRLLGSYLLGRRQFVEIRGVRSSPVEVTSGVPQGSIMGPVLFNIFIDGLVKVVIGHSLLYADDMKIFLPIKSLEDSVTLQNDLDRISEWCYRNGLLLNATKCSVMSFTRSKTPLLYDYRISGTPLPRSATCKDLGVTFDPGLTFIDHTLNLEAQAYKSLGFIYRTSKDFSNADTLVTLFRSLVLSRLEYASIVWSPSYTKYIDVLENILRKFLKLLAFKLDGTYPVIGYPQTALLRRFGFSCLERRRQCAFVLFLFKLINSQIDSPALLQQLNFAVPRLEARFPQSFYSTPARTKTLQSSPINTCYSCYSNVQDNIDIFSTSASLIKRHFSEG